MVPLETNSTRSITFIAIFLCAVAGLALLYRPMPSGGKMDGILSGSFINPLSDQNLQEIVSQRSRFATVYRLSDNSRVMRISTDPIHYQDANGNWHVIDTRIAPSTDPNFGFQMVKDDYHAYFKTESSSQYLIRYQAKGAEIRFGIDQHQTWGILDTATAQATGNTILYKNIYPGVDVRYELSPTQMLEEFIVTDKSLASHIDQIQKRFSVKDATWKIESDGSIAFYNNNAERIWSVPKPVMYERGNKQNRNYGIYYKVVTKDGYYDLVKVIKPSGKRWLSDPNRQFPVVIDDTVVLADKNLAGGEGFVQTDFTTYQRRTNQSQLIIGAVPTQTLTYRAFLEWDTSAIPKNAKIQSVGIFFHPTQPYGAGNTVDVKQLSNPISSYPDDNLHNQQLFNDIGNANSYEVGLFQFQSDKATVDPLGYDGYTLNTVVQDLQNKVATGAPFGIGLVGSNETNAYTEMIANGDSAHPDDHPALIVFYDGIRGESTPIIRPLRNSFFDGKYYWAFFRNGYGATTGQFYYYSPDGTTWTQAGQLSTSGNQHHDEWYDPTSNTVLAAYAVQVVDAYTDMYFQMGQVHDTPTPTITWSSATVLFQATRNPTTDGYDFPSAILDSNKNCWVLARHVTTTTTGLVIRKSTDSTCSAWGPPTVVLAPTANGGDSGVGGYAVPLTNGKVYVVYKNLNALMGVLYDGTAWSAPETIDNNAAFGVYSQGMSVVAVGDVVHLLYIGGDGSVKYNSWNGAWGTAITLDSTATFWSPSLSLDTSTGTFYAVYRTSGNNDIADGSVYYKEGTSPYAINDWSAPVAITTAAYSPETLIGAAVPGATSPWSLSTNYSGNGVNYVLLVDGVYGLSYAPLLPIRTVYLPLILK